MKEINLLLVDDSEEDRGIVRTMLNRSPQFKYKIKEVVSGEEAIEYLQRQTCNCMLLDHNLPDMTGLDILKRLDNIPQPPATILLTGSSEEGIDINALKSGATDYLSKGEISANNLERAIYYSIEKHAITQQLKDAKQTQELFLAAFSHEMKNPISTIRGYSELILEGKYDPITEKQKTVVNKLINTVDFLNELIENILLTALLQKKQIILDSEQIDLVKEINFCIEIMKSKIQENNISLDFNPSFSDLKIHASRQKINQVIINLLSNAIKFSVNGRVGISLSLSETQVVISVKDNGIGMTKEQMEKIFLPYAQADNTIRKKYGGTGLGLSIVQQIVDLHGGTVQVKSEENIGTEFIITLPYTAN